MLRFLSIQPRNSRFIQSFPTISSFSLQQEQKRCYIFVPTMKEVMHSIQELFKDNSQKLSNTKLSRELIIKKLVEHRNKQIKALRNLISTYNQSRRKRMNGLNQWLSTKQLNYRSRKQYLKKFLTMKRDVYYQKIIITLDEPIDSKNFNSLGLPLVSRNKVSGRFINPWNPRKRGGTHSIFLFFLWQYQRFWKLHKQDKQPMHFPDFPPSSATLASPKTKPNDSNLIDKIKLTWIGHSTCLVSMNNFTILTDPMFSNRASIFQSFGGVARSVPPSHSIADLENIDVVVISHDHYDHLDYESVLQLSPKVKYWCVPLGMRQWFKDYVQDHIDLSRVLEMGWWDSIVFERNSDTILPVSLSVPHAHHLNSLRVTCTPAHHYACRTPFDLNVRLWCSYAISSLHSNFYFAGDTAYPQKFPLHEQIYEQCGPFDLCAIPIGAYEPSFFMKDSHVDPYEAKKIHDALRSKKSVAIHWGTFNLADEPMLEPPLLLKQALSNSNNEHEEFVVVKHGESTYSN